MRLPIQRYWNLLAHYMLPQWPMLNALTLSLFCGIGLRLLLPQLAGAFVDKAVAGNPLSTLLLVATAFCLVGGVEQFLTALSTYLGIHIAWIATNRLRTDLVAHCLRLDMDFHHAHTPGEMIERVDGDIQQLGNFFSEFAVQLLGNLLLIIGALVILLGEDWRIGAVFIVFTSIALVVFSRVRDVAAPFWRAARQASADLYSAVEERLDGIPDLRANGATAYAERVFSVANGHLFHRNRRAVAMSVIVGNGAELILVLGSVAALAVSAVLYQSGTVTLGTVFLVTMYAALINMPLREIISQIDDLQRATASIARVEELNRLQPSITDGAGTRLDDRSFAVAFEDVSFNYPGWPPSGPDGAPDGTPVLSNISFRLAPREVLGLIGRTGSGKTTLIRLLLRLYDPASGHISINGEDLRDARLEELRGRIGVVSQDVRLFSASIRDNLTLFDPDISDERIVAVVRELGLYDWYSAQPHGLDTILRVGEGGLSAGEAQLLAVARVFLKDPAIIILDEPSSRLDPATERRLEHAWDRLLAGRTAIIIAHHLRTVQRADTILLLEQGQIQEYGPRATLAADPQSRFYRLLHLGLDEVLASE